jgi:hypothetical protein
VHT